MLGQAAALKTGQSETLNSLKEDLKNKGKKTKSLKGKVEGLLGTADDVAFLQGTVVLTTLITTNVLQLQN